jgi:hypothetical protein
MPPGAFPHPAYPLALSIYLGPFVNVPHTGQRRHWFGPKIAYGWVGVVQRGQRI